MRSTLVSAVLVTTISLLARPSRLAADWPMDRGDAARTARVAQPLPLPLELQWTVRWPHSPAPAWPTSTRIRFDQAFQPVVSAGEQVVLGNDGRVSVLQPAANGIVWEAPVEGVTHGYCLDLGSGDARLACELARRSQLRIIAVDSDPDQVAQARRMLTAAGLYGTRVVVHCRPLSETGYPSYFADLIVSRRSFETPLDPPVEREAERLQRPYGGLLCLGPADAMRVSRRGPLPGAGGCGRSRPSTSPGPPWSIAPSTRKEAPGICSPARACRFRSSDPTGAGSWPVPST